MISDYRPHGDKGPISLADISQRQAISLSYLEQLFAKLRKGALVSSVRGPGGGYELQRASSSIFIAQIIDAVNESVDTTKYRGKGDCQGGDTCLTHYLWEDLSNQIHRFLEGISLADLVAKNEVRRIAQEQDRKQLITSESSHSGQQDAQQGAQQDELADIRVPVSSL